MIDALLSADGKHLLSQLPPYDPQNVFSLTTQLRASGFDPELIAAALTQSRLRDKAASKFGPFAQEMFFTADGVEQATRLSVGVHHAQRFRAAHAQHVIDLGCGIGADSMAFAGLGLHVSAIEQDGDTALAARANLSPFPEATVIHADGRELDLAELRADALWLDPARRHNGQRINDPEHWSPALSTALTLAKDFPTAGIKVAPGIDYDYLPPNAHVQWISVNGDLLEAVIWLGEAAPEPGRSALVIHDQQTTAYDAQVTSADSPADMVEPRELAHYLYEPDPAIIRSGAIARLCAEFNLAPVSHNIAYLSGADAHDSPLLTRFVVDDVLPFDVKKVRAYLGSRGIGVVEIKKRGTTIDPALWRKKLKLNPKNTAQATLIATPIEGHHRIVVAHRG